MAISRRNGEASFHRRHRIKCHWRPHIKCLWRPKEDERLTRLVSSFGPENWERIASYIPGRSGKSCRFRWINKLDPRLNKTPFTEEENEMHLHHHRTHGNREPVLPPNVDPRGPLVEESAQLTEMGPTPAYVVDRIGSPILRRLGIDSSQFPVPQPQNGVKFFDFMGVGNSE